MKGDETDQTTRVIIIIAAVLFGAVLLFLLAFSFFRKDTGDKDIPETEVIASDPLATLLVSEDEGKTWRGISNTRFGVSKLVFHPETNDLYVGTARNGLWRSDYGSEAFVQLKDKKVIVDDTAQVQDVVPTTQNPKGTEVYAAMFYDTKGHVVSFQAGDYNELFFTPLTRSLVFDIASSPQNPSQIYLVSSDGGFLESADGGERWQTVFRFNESPTHLVTHPDVLGKFWVTTANGKMYHSTTEGQTWEDISAGFTKFPQARNIKNLYLDVASEVLYLTSQYGLLRSFDDGESWEAVNLIVPPASLPITALAVHPFNSEMLFISAASQLYKSTDGGGSWKATDFMGNRTITSIIFDPEDPERVIIGFDR